VFAFDYDRDDGLVSNRRVWIGPEAGPGFPDGAAVDADGCYWSARWGGGCVLRVAPDGRIDHQISLPVQRVSMVAFGGSDLRTMFITTATEGATDAELAAEPLAGSVFAVDTGVTGLAEPEFAA
jgi:sugar lactone lactonase YvrE